uniref:Lipoprotein n=1 Tax=candidate division WOR-3 bacterium TaxID=2052148 RepID=A0A7C6EBQ1_UNCW3
MKIYKGEWIVTLLPFLMLIGGCATMRSQWEATKSKNSIRAYEDFIRKYPEGALADEARSKIERLKIESDYRDALSKNTLSAYYSFLRKYYKIKEINRKRFIPNNDLVDSIIFKILTVIDNQSDIKNYDATLLKILSALGEAGLERYNEQGFGGMFPHNIVVSVQPEAFGGNPTYIFFFSPLPKGQATFRDLYVDLFWNEHGVCYKKEPRYNKGSIIILENGTLYVYDGKEWFGPYP